MKANRFFDSYAEGIRVSISTQPLLAAYYIPMKAIGLQRARASKGDSKPRTPKKSRDWIYCVGNIIKEQLIDNEYETIAQPAAARIIIGHHKGRRPDFDNIEKAILDACQRGDDSGQYRALADDRFVRHYVEKMEVTIPKDQEEFIWIRFYQAAEDFYAK